MSRASRTKELETLTAEIAALQARAPRPEDAEAVLERMAARFNAYVLAKEAGIEPALNPEQRALRTKLAAHLRNRSVLDLAGAAGGQPLTGTLVPSIAGPDPTLPVPRSRPLERMRQRIEEQESEDRIAPYRDHELIVEPPA